MCEKNIFSCFAQIAFTEENKFNLNGPGKYKKLWVTFQKHIVKKGMRDLDSKSLMIHCCIMYFPYTFLNEIVGNYASLDFIELLKNKFILQLTTNIGYENFISQ